MNPEDIGGKVFGTANDWFGGADPDTNQLTQLASALKAAAPSTRRFHRMSQWCPTFRKFAIAAVGTGQWTMGQAWMHEETVLKLAETERVLSNQPMTAAVYEDMARKAWHQRAERGDPLWILEDEVKKVNEGILATARARIRVVLQPNSGPRGQGQAGSASTDQEASLLAKQTATAEAIARRAAQATKELQRQQDLLERQASRRGPPELRAIEDDPNRDSRKGGKGGGKSQQQYDDEQLVSKRQQKSKSFWKNFRANKPGRGDGGGKSWRR